MYKTVLVAIFQCIWLASPQKAAERALLITVYELFLESISLYDALTAVSDHCKFYKLHLMDHSLCIDDRDHSAGNAVWRRRFNGIKIFGGALESVPAATE